MIPKLEPLRYCHHKIGNNGGTCANLATRQVILSPRKENIALERPTTIIKAYRCEDHCYAGTNSKKVIESIEIDQSDNIDKVNKFLFTLLGKRISSKFHTARELEVKYVKPNGGIMCLQPITGKWKFVYYNQITEIL